MNTLGELFNKSCSYLDAKGIKSAKRATELLFMRALKIDRLELYLNFEKPLSSPEVTLLRERLQKRSEGIPDAYVDGRVEFLGCEISVSPDVLIPRPETELLAEKVISYIKSLSTDEVTVWDLCTGSGALAIAIKKCTPRAKVFASDISSKALDIAHKNAELNQVEITFYEGDLFEPFELNQKGQKVDLIISNPPYIGQSESISEEVSKFEPSIALYGGPDGLEFYRRIAQKAPIYLKPEGALWLEIGYSQENAIKEIFSAQASKEEETEAKIWDSIRCYKDYSGWSRYFYLERGQKTLYD